MAALIDRTGLVFHDGTREATSLRMILGFGECRTKIASMRSIVASTLTGLARDQRLAGTLWPSRQLVRELLVDVRSNSDAKTA